MKRLFFVRHGLAQFNVENRFAGQVDTPLTDEGRQQASEAGRQLNDTGIKFDLIFSSPLSRANETAILIAKELAYSQENLRTEQLLLERSFGELEGSFAPDFFDKHTYRDIDEVPGAETIEMLQNRADKMIEKLRRTPDENILVVGHGAFGRAFIRVSKGEPHMNEYTNPFVQIPNAEPIEIKFH